MVKGQGHWERTGIDRFSRIFSSKVDRFRETKTKIGPFYAYRQTHFTSENVSRFVQIICNLFIVRDGRRMSQRPPDVYLLVEGNDKC